MKCDVKKCNNTFPARCQAANTGATGTRKQLTWAWRSQENAGRSRAQTKRMDCCHLSCANNVPPFCEELIGPALPPAAPSPPAARCEGVWHCPPNSPSIFEPALPIPTPSSRLAFLSRLGRLSAAAKQSPARKMRSTCVVCLSDIRYFPSPIQT